jgi:hypothetical protein
LSTDLNGAAWFKSSRSSSNGQCVEVAFVDEQVAVRDSKDPAGAVLVFSKQAWSAFVAGIGADDFLRS